MVFADSIPVRALFEELHQALSRGVLQILAETYLGTEFDVATMKRYAVPRNFSECG
jgi:hypothetical protein